jgi:hypothetical protein
MLIKLVLRLLIVWNITGNSVRQCGPMYAVYTTTEILKYYDYCN